MSILLNVVKFLMKGTVKKTLIKMNEDPELKVAIKGMNHHQKELERLTKENKDKYGFNL